MNIFVLDEDPVLAAQYHNDKHVVKMITETAQILSTVHSLYDSNINVYKPTHPKHPCTLWASENQYNYDWLWQLGKALYDEYQFRYENRVHKAGENILRYLRPVPQSQPIGNTGLGEFVQAMPDHFKSDSPIVAYRNLYMGDRDMKGKRYIASWKRRGEPWWWK